MPTRKEYMTTRKLITGNTWSGTGYTDKYQTEVVLPDGVGWTLINASNDNNFLYYHWERAVDINMDSFVNEGD